MQEQTEIGDLHTSFVQGPFTSGLFLFFGQGCVYMLTKYLVFQLFYDSGSDLFTVSSNSKKPQGCYFFVCVVVVVLFL